MHYMRWRSTGDPGTAEYLRVPGTPDRTEKACTKCRVVQPLENFHKDKRTRDGRQSSCKTCYAGALRSGALVRKYGITAEDYEAMVAAQRGRCPVCKEQPDRLVVDHCHRTGKVRALLCDRCNRLLGVADDDPQLLKAAVGFLAAH